MKGSHFGFRWHLGIHDGLEVFFSVSLKFASHIVLAEAYEGDALGSVAEGIG